MRRLKRAKGLNQTNMPFTICSVKGLKAGFKPVA